MQKSSHKPLMLLAGFALCLAEVFVVQERTLLLPGQTRDLALVLQSLVRLFWDAGVCALLVLTLHRNVLALVFALQFAFFNVAILYRDYFRHPLSIVDGLRSISESIFVAPHGATLIDPWVVGVLFAVMMGKLALVGGAGERASERGLDGGTRRRWALRSGLVAVVALTVGLGATPAVEGQGLVTRYGPSVGYVVPSAMDATLPYSDRLLARALEAGRHPTDRLTPVETPIPLGDQVVIAQVESLDWGVVDLDLDGRAVTPFLRALKGRSMFYKLEAIHIHGSADADFVAMTGRLPSPDTIPYYVAGYPYDEALPHLLRTLGYRSTFLHGVSGSFFKRRAAYEQMGFDRLIFAEELAADFALVKPPRQLGFDDHVLFDVAATELLAHEGKAFAFLVTVTSHGPFDAVPEGEPLLFAKPATAAERYFNSIHYVDRALEAFIDKLPAGTTVVLYGDHVSQVDHPGYDPGIDGRREFVPLYIHNVGDDLSAAQATRQQPIATEGRLNFVDVSAYLRAMAIRSGQVAGLPEP